MKTASIHMTSYGWMYISSLNFLVKSLSTGKMWRGFWCSHRYINIYVAMLEDLDTEEAVKEVDIVVMKPMHSQ